MNNKYISFHINTHSIIHNLISTKAKELHLFGFFFLLAFIYIEKKNTHTTFIDLSSNGILLIEERKKKQYEREREREIKKQKVT
jgi:hypothetical protein